MVLVQSVDLDKVSCTTMSLIRLFMSENQSPVLGICKVLKPCLYVCQLLNELNDAGATSGDNNGEDDDDDGD